MHLSALKDFKRKWKGRGVATWMNRLELRLQSDREKKGEKGRAKREGERVFRSILIFLCIKTMKKCATDPRQAWETILLRAWERKQQRKNLSIHLSIVYLLLSLHLSLFLYLSFSLFFSHSLSFTSFQLLKLTLPGQTGRVTIMADDASEGYKVTDGSVCKWYYI